MLKHGQWIGAAVLLAASMTQAGFVPPSISIVTRMIVKGRRARSPG